VLLLPQTGAAEVALRAELALRARRQHTHVSASTSSSLQVKIIIKMTLHTIKYCTHPFVFGPKAGSHPCRKIEDEKK
jgi:hypothetical protein